MVKVNLNLSYWDIFEKREPLGVFEVDDVQKLFEYVYRTVAKEYRDLATIGKSTHEGYLIDNENIPRKGDGVPEPESVGHSIDIRFGRGYDSNILITEISELFEVCDRYTSEFRH